MLETQISQVAQQVSQPKTNQINIITLRNGRQIEDPVVETKKNEVEKESNEPLGNEVEVESEKPQSEKVIGEGDKPIVTPPYCWNKGCFTSIPLEF